MQIITLDPFAAFAGRPEWFFAFSLIIVEMFDDSFCRFQAWQTISDQRLAERSQKPGSADEIGKGIPA